MDDFLFLPRAIAFALFDIAYAVALGSLLSRLWLGPAVTSQKDDHAALVELLRRTLTICAFAMLLLLAVQWWLLTATMMGTTSFLEIRGQLMTVLRGTHAGIVLMPQFLAVFALLLLASLRRVAAKPMGIYGGFFLVAALTCVRAASGHASAEGDLSFAEAVQFLHLASIALWAGGVIIAGLMVLPRLARDQGPTSPMTEMTHFAHCLSRSSTWAVLLVGITGCYKGWTGLGESLKPLGHTQWGMLLTAKSALVILALAAGVKNRLSLNRRVFAEGGALSFLCWLKAEAFVMVAILVLSGFLANSPPATDP